VPVGASMSDAQSHPNTLEGTLVAIAALTRPNWGGGGGGGNTGGGGGVDRQGWVLCAGGGKGRG